MDKTNFTALFLPNGIKLFILVMTVLSGAGCSSTKLISEWRRPDSENVLLNKVLVLGITADAQIRTAFESRLTEGLKNKGINAVSSLQVLDDSFQSIPKNLPELKEIEKELMREDFDAILITKVVGHDEKTTTLHSLKELTMLFQSFKEDIIENNRESELANERDFTVYHVASSLYCICDGEEESNIAWRTNIDIRELKKEPKHVEGNGVKKYTRLFLKALEKQDLFVTE